MTELWKDKTRLDYFLKGRKENTAFTFPDVWRCSSVHGLLREGNKTLVSYQQSVCTQLCSRTCCGCQVHRRLFWRPHNPWQLFLAPSAHIWNSIPRHHGSDAAPPMEPRVLWVGNRAYIFKPRRAKTCWASHSERQAGFSGLGIHTKVTDIQFSLQANSFSAQKSKVNLSDALFPRR